MKKKQIIGIGIGLLSVIFIMISIPLFLFPNLFDVSERYYSGLYFDWTIFLLIAGGLLGFSLVVLVMNRKKPDDIAALKPAGHPFLISAFALIFFALILVIAAIIAGMSDTLRSTLILSSFTCFMMGFIIMTFHQDEPAVQQAILSSPVSDMMNECAVLAKLGIHGNAHICEKTDGKGLFQFNPGAAGVSFASIPDSPGAGAEKAGISLIPSGYVPMQRLEREYRMVIPENDAAVADFIADLYTRHLELADAVEVRYDGDGIDLLLKGYRNFQQCRTVEQQAAGCCARVPCASCSLLACLLARSAHAPVAFEKVVQDVPSRTVTVRLRRSLPQELSGRGYRDN